jgi:NADPH:quinone reductase-like Zn-dependent oxidoreductase
MQQDKMKAVICPKYGPPEVFRLAEVEKPVSKEDEILVEIRASAVTNSDLFIRGSNIPLKTRIPFRLMMGIFRPRKKIQGEVFAGVVKETGGEITRFKTGDEVYGLTGFKLGAYAQFDRMKETDSTRGCVSIKPKNISFEEATAAIYGGMLALQALEKGNIKDGQHILIYGASSTTGTFAVQYGKAVGARVTAVCGGRHAAFVKSLGADEVIDYTTTDRLDRKTRFSFVLDAVGKRKTSKLKESCKNALTDGGIYASIDDESLKLNSKRGDYITRLVEEGKVKPVLDKVYPLEHIIEAHQYVEQGHKLGGVALTVSH